MSDLEPIRVLLVEDDNAYAALVTAGLRSPDDHIVLTRAATLGAALASIATVSFDAILLDPGLPDSDGLPTVRRIHAAAPRTALVVLTSNPDDRLAIATVQHGAEDYLVKQDTGTETVLRAIRHARERVAFRLALLESEARKSAIIDGALDAVVTVDRDGVITEFNLAAEQMFGRTRAEAIGRKVGPLIIPPEFHDRHDAAFAATNPSSPPGVLRRRLELSGLRADGTRFPLELSLVKLPSSEGAQYAAFMRDLSEQRQTEQALRATAEQLRQAAKMEAVGRLAGGVAHDFNNVLTAIFGYVDLLLDQFGEHDPRRPDLQEIRVSAERAASLTRQLLAFSRKQVMQPRIINVNEVIEGLQTLLVRLVTDDVRPWLGLAPDVWQVRVDPGQIEQVLMNLAANARDAMPEGGRLGIETANVVVDEEDPVKRPGLRRGEYVLMTVSDTGQGMPEDVRSHIFEPFFTTKAQGKGTGLGLATVYGIVKQSGGGVYAESAEGEGTRFLIYLPRVPPAS
jgi:PAS domain S-box-containing protein